jgi:hydrogenase-4 component F
MFLAAPFILVQTNLKRLLAYSSLEHIGLICVGIGLNSPVTIFGALLHMGYHALTKPVLFLPRATSIKPATPCRCGSSVPAW